MCSTPKANQQLKATCSDNVVSIVSALDEGARQAFTERANKAAEKRLKDNGYLVEHTPIQSLSKVFNDKDHIYHDKHDEPDKGIITFISDIFGKLLHR